MMNHTTIFVMDKRFRNNIHKHLAKLITNCLGLPLFSIFISVSSLSCDFSTGPQEESGVITYTVSGGFAGGTHTKLIVDQYGSATLASEYPPLKEQLTTQEYNSLFSLLSGFNSLPDSAIIHCIDSFIYTVEYKTGSNKKTFAADGCALSESNDPSIIKFKSLVNELGKLADKIYNNQAPWLGLAAEYKIDKNIYKLGEPIKLTYILKNPTDNEHTLYFKGQHQIYFQAYKRYYPYLYYSYPQNLQSDTLNPTQITLPAGGERTINYVWDQGITDQNGIKIQAPAGMYSLTMFFIGSKVNADHFFFDIVDPSVPVEGNVISDYNGENSYSQYYSFNLYLKNWTNSSVTLNFPNNQKIFVQLYTDDLPSNRKLLYESPTIKDGLSSRVTIPALTDTTFSYKQDKDRLNLGNSSWFYVKIKLLNQNFERDAEVQIYDYSK